MATARVTYSKIVPVLVWALILLSLYLTSLYSYLLFHSLAEIFSIIVACGIFMLAWNSRRFLENNYLLFIGIVYLFVAILDLVHTLTYKGMDVFPDAGANLPTQLWISARYLESISLLIAPFFLKRTFWPRFTFFVCVAVVGLILITIFYWQVFPACYIEGIGLTPFKKLSEYVISLMLVGSIVLLLRSREEFDPDVLRLLFRAIIFTIGAELAFTFYVGVYDLSNLVGHLLKILSFYLIYKAVIETGVIRPYSILLSYLKQSEERLRQYTLELQARNEDLDAFARTVAHDLKTPLFSITICSNLLEEDQTLSFNEDQQELLDNITETAFTMNNIVDELLLLAEVRKVEVQVEPLDMTLLVSGVIKRLAHLLQECQGEVVSPDTWPVVLGHGPWVEEVWVNYISNAIKYGGRPPRIELGAAQLEDRVRFWVKDNGLGLAPQDQAQLFNSFTQLRQVRVTGHGLGLSIVKRIVDKLNGEVGVESEGVPGQGSLFFFTLPNAQNGHPVNRERK
jgi:signal transduction histidine kinase